LIGITALIGSAKYTDTARLMRNTARLIQKRKRKRKRENRAGTYCFYKNQLETTAEEVEYRYPTSFRYPLTPTGKDGMTGIPLFSVEVRLRLRN